MKKKKLILNVILPSIISWIIWALIFSSIFYIKQNNIKINNNNEIIHIKELEEKTTNIIKKVSPSVVSIVIKEDLLIYKSDPRGFFRQPIWSIKRKVWWWTWFFITKNWKILTNKHVVYNKNAVYTIITNSWEEFDSTVLALDPINDLAVLQIKSNKKDFPSLEIKNENDNIEIWQFALAIWNALAEFENSVSFWIISWVNRNIDSQYWVLSWLIQTDAAINPWNSGWPLIDLNWKVIWINTAIIDWAEWIWFAISISKEKIIYILDSIRRFGKIKRPFIWISYIPISPWIKKKLWLQVDYWAYIIDEFWSIAKWSSADKAWLKPWDIITKIDWKIITSKDNINNIIQNKIPWTTIKLHIINKNWIEKDISLVLWEY